TYSTPDGTHTGDAEKATTSYIAQQIHDLLVAQFPSLTISLDGAYVGISGGTDVTVASNSGDIYLGTSNNHTVRAVTDLPAHLTANMDGYIVGVGADNNSLVYYRWDESS